MPKKNDFKLDVVSVRLVKDGRVKKRKFFHASFCLWM